MNRRGIASFLVEHAKQGACSFHMPGHKGTGLYRRFGYGEFLDRFFDCDITEITGADNLFQPEGIIEATMSKYRRLYGAEASYLLVNGTSGGLIASILASVAPGRKLIMARNCHKSVFNALTLGGIRPIYAYPTEIKEYGIAGPMEALEIHRLLEENPDADAVILPSPNYYGICSDIRAIADVVHSFGKILIVDQAHGAHLRFFHICKGWSHALPMPMAAEDCGADMVVGSVHKTLGSLTQSAVLNVCSGGAFGGLESPTAKCISKQGACAATGGAPNGTERTASGGASGGPEGVATGGAPNGAERTASGGASKKRDLKTFLYRLEDKLQAIESTSPSYLLMGSLDINADLLLEHGSQLMKEWQENLIWFYSRAEGIPGLRILGHPNLRPESADSGNAGMDLTKINLDMSRLDLDGSMLERELMKYGIYAELITGDILMCMTGIGNRREDYQRLLQALTEISRRARTWEHMDQEKRTDPNGARKSADELVDGVTGGAEDGPTDGSTRSASDEPADGAQGGAEDGPADGSTGSAADGTARGAHLWTRRRPLRELPTDKERIPIEESPGRICAASIIPYPPGIPLICPGEEIGEEEIAYVKELRARGEKVMGIDAEGRIVVGCEEG